MNLFLILALALTSSISFATEKLNCDEVSDTDYSVVMSMSIPHLFVNGNSVASCGELDLSRTTIMTGELVILKENECVVKDDMLIKCLK